MITNSIAVKKVDFLIAGMQKSGTTALFRYLENHPDLCLSKTKELHFFDNEEMFKSNQVNYEAYHSNFDNSKEDKVWGEATPIYTYWEPSLLRIKEYNPNIKLIILIRNPIECAYSHWNMQRSRGIDNLPFIKAIESEKIRCSLALSRQHRLFSYIDRGFYSIQLKKFLTFLITRRC